MHENLARVATGTVAVAATNGQDSVLGTFGEWAVQVMSALGAPGIGFLVALENLFPPIPSEIILPLGGFAASNGAFTIWEAILWATAGSVFGAYALYGVGRALGHDRTVAIARKMPLVDASDIDKTTAWFRKHGTKAVFFGRMLPIFRSLISIPAGIEKMPLGIFGLLTLAGSLIWNTIFVTAGFFLGEQWDVVLKYADVLKYIVIAGVLLFIGWWLYGKLRKRRGGEPADADGLAG